MLKNYLKIALRNILKQKFYSVVNVLGLAIGVACCLLILLFVQDDLSFDQYHEKSDQIFRVASDIQFGGNHLELAVAPAPMAAALKEDFPEVETSMRFRNRGRYLIRREGATQNYKEEDLAFADPTFFDIFSIPLLKGDAESVLKEPNTLVISEAMVEKYFQEEDPVGKTLILDDNQNYKVAGVFQDIPRNSHFHFDFLMAMEGLGDSKNTSWLSNNYHTYVLLKEGSDPAAFEAKFPALFKKYAGPQVMQMLNMSIEEVSKTGQGVKYYLQPLPDIHLNSDLTAEFEPNGNLSYVYIFSSIAIFILLIACINFMNLATARSSNRAKEVGVRKVLGSIRKNLIRQFLVESTAVAVISFLIAIIIAEAVLPSFNNLVNRELSIPYFNPAFASSLLLGALGIGLIAGIYPAFYLSSFNPVQVLKGKLGTNIKTGWFRNSLVVFQFVISIFLIIGTLVINKQLNFIKNKRLGFDKEQVLLLHDAYALGDQTLSFKEQANQFSEVKNASISCYLPVNSSRSDLIMWPEGPMTDENSVSMQYWRVDHDYVKTMDMEIVEGRDFSIDMNTDSVGIIINETAAKLFGFENPIGERISTFNGPPGADDRSTSTVTILGVIKDFHYETLREKVDALGLVIGSCRGYVALRYQSDDPAAFVQKIENLWTTMAPGQPFDYSFMDDRFSTMYEAEQRTGNIFFIFAMLAIFVACLGLFALATYTAERRAKEIGIRKIMGASISNIFVLLSSEFTKWILIAYIIALPMAWYYGNRWLQDFSYQTSLDASTFILAAGLAFVIALITVSYQAIRAAVSNPVNSLRHE